MNKTKLIHFFLKDSVFHRKLYFVIGDPEKTKAHLNRKFNITDEEDLEEISLENMGCFSRVAQGEGETIIFLVWLKEFNGKSRDIGILAHEILHMTFDVMDYVGIEYDTDISEEVYTYYSDSILTQALDKLYA